MPAREFNPGIRDPGIIFNPEIRDLTRLNPGIQGLKTAFFRCEIVHKSQVCHDKRQS